jgi:SAM-dependent methyltransferase
VKRIGFNGPTATGIQKGNIIMNVLRKVCRATRRAYQDHSYRSAARSALIEARGRLLESPELSEDEKSLLDKVVMDVHRNDVMYQGDAVHYLSAGLSGLRCILEVLASAGRDLACGSILDFPSGYGRVLRIVRAKFPHADITAAELDEDAVAFCARNFSTTPLLSVVPISALKLERRYDLIWCGSLLTHVEEADAQEILRFFHDHLVEGGICIFTTHGLRPVDWIKTGRETYGLSPEGQAEVVRGFETNGYGYVDYPYQPGYGISAVTREHARVLAAKAGDWTELLFKDHGWDECQDVHAYIRR